MTQATNRLNGSLIFAIWLFWAAMLLAFSMRAGDGVMVDPDDFMRMAQVRDWMAGQSWFDVTQYRINPPHGGLMHWSRFLDVPIAVLIMLGSAFMPIAMAEYFAILALPVLLLAVLMLLTYKTVCRLTDQRTALFAAFLAPTFPLILRQFMPGRIDHHSWQIVMASLAMFALFDRNAKRSALLMAFALSFWMHISIEGLPYAVIFGAILALCYVFPVATTGQVSDTRLFPYLTGLAVFSTALLVVTQSRANLFVPHCDAVSWPLLAALFGVSVLLGAGHIFFRPAKPVPKIAILAIAAIAGAAIFLSSSASCATDPFGNLTPLVREYWHETISEGLPIHSQAAAIISLLLFVPILFAFWMVLLLRQETDLQIRKQWVMLAILVFAATLLSFKVQRTAGVAELFALPGIAALTAALVFRIGASPHLLVRVLGSVLAIVALSPMTAFVGGDAIFAKPSKPEVKMAAKNQKRGCDLADLKTLPKGLIFTTMAAGPEILYRTDHSVFVSGYHRNNQVMDQLITTMIGPVEKAPLLLSAAKVDYVVFCPTHFEAKSYIPGNKDAFASMLMSGDHPDWLQPVPEFSDSDMRVYRYRPMNKAN
jgi:hypothetical protein